MSHFALKFERLNFADVVYALTATLHTNLSLKSEIIINHHFKVQFSQLTNCSLGLLP